MGESDKLEKDEKSWAEKIGSRKRRGVEEEDKKTKVKSWQK